MREPKEANDTSNGGRNLTSSETRSLRFLDIDLDAFLSDVAHSKSGIRRLSAKRFVPWTEERLIRFLEDQCGLSVSSPIPGRFVIHHDGAFNYWHQLVASTGQTLDVVHIDGHADLGFGDSSWVQLTSEQLILPPVKRGSPPRGVKACNPGSYLAYAIAARWISQLSYVYPPGGGNDLPIIYFSQNDPRSGQLELKSFSSETHKSYLENLDYEGTFTKENATAVESLVPFSAVPIGAFRTTATFDFGLLCQSPGFTPKKSDALIHVIARYIAFDAQSAPLPK
jgi:hypothetical protein